MILDKWDAMLFFKKRSKDSIKILHSWVIHQGSMQVEPLWIMSISRIDINLIRPKDRVCNPPNQM